jgi:hypothetical protein
MKSGCVSHRRKLTSPKRRGNLWYVFTPLRRVSFRQSFHNIQSLVGNIQHISNISTFAERNSNGILSNLIPLKIVMGRHKGKQLIL